MKRKVEYRAQDPRGFSVPELRKILQDADDQAELKVTRTRTLSQRPIVITVETEVDDAAIPSA